MYKLSVIIFAVVFSVSMSGVADAARDNKAQSNACIEKCEKQKEQCFSQYKKSDASKGTYITPEGHKVCWQAYHECKKSCPK